jgi:phenylacetate-CoA ligase
MNETVDPILGWTLSKLGDLAISSWGAYRLLFAPVLGGTSREWFSRKRAAAAFFNARRTVPAYQEFLRQHDAEHPATFQDIPPMDKESYIKRWPIEALCQGGRLPLRGAVIDESSGSSGTASNWVRGSAERLATRRLIQYSARSTFGDDSFVLLNCFALGPWATGMNVSMSMVDVAILKSTGPDATKIVNTLRQFGPQYRYLICGYPPFLKRLLETADMDLSQYRIAAAVGGEGMSESLRDYLLRAFDRVYSSFGASDLEINIAAENDFTIALRRLLRDRPDVAGALGLPRGSLPMVFQYNPLDYYIEVNEVGELLISICRLDSVSPKIRYNLHDVGGVVRFPELRRALAVVGMSPSDLQSRHLDLPLLFHYGRSDATIAFYGANVGPADVQEAVYAVPELQDVVSSFALLVGEDEDANKTLALAFEVAPGRDAPSPERLGDLRDAVLGALARANQDYREASRFIPPGFEPTIEFHRAGEGPFADHDVRLKRAYVKPRD